MICKNCGGESSRIKYIRGREFCSNCAGFSEVGKTRVDGINTRSSFRVRSEAIKFEGDLISPQFYNKTRRKVDINPDFVKRFPDQAREYFTNEEMVDSGLPGLAKHSDKLSKSDSEHKEKLAASLEFEGDTKKAVDKVISSLKKEK